MNYILKASIYILFIYVVVSATVYDGYNKYMAGEYLESYKLYHNAYSRSEVASDHKNALYGMVNSLAALERWQEAINWSDTLLNNSFDLIMAEKKLSILPMVKASDEAKLLYGQIEKSNALSDGDKISILVSTGWGFYRSKMYRDALYWFSKADSLKPNSLEITDAISLANKSIKDRVLINVNSTGGAILYSNNEISERRGSDSIYYGYESGWYWQGAGEIIINHIHSFTLMGSQFGAKFRGYLITDTLYASNGDSPSDKRYFSSSFINNNGDEDTAYLVYNDTLVSSSFNPKGYDVIRLDDAREDNIYIGYEGYRLGGTSLTLGGGINYTTKSNVSGIEEGLSIWLLNRHSFSFMDMAFNWYYTGTDKFTMAQISPSFIKSFKDGKIRFEIEPQMVFKISGSDDYDLDKFQASIKTGLSFNFKSISIGLNGIFGKETFALSNNGQNQNTVLLKHNATGSFYIGLRPFPAKNLTIFGLSRYENYEQMNRAIIMGGLDLWI